MQCLIQRTQVMEHVWCVIIYIRTLIELCFMYSSVSVSLGLPKFHQRICRFCWFGSTVPAYGRRNITKTNSTCHLQPERGVFIVRYMQRLSCVWKFFHSCFLLLVNSVMNRLQNFLISGYWWCGWLPEYPPNPTIWICKV